MAGVSGLTKKILSGQIVGLQDDIRRLLQGSPKGTEGQVIVRTCSRYVYENQGVEEDRFSALMDILDTCHHYHQQHINSEPFHHLKSLFYFVILAVKRKDLQKHALKLVGETEAALERCDTSKEEIWNMVKRLHSTVWNASLAMTDPLEALALQKFTLRCSLVLGTKLSVVCGHASMAHKAYETTKRGDGGSDSYFQGVFEYVTDAVKKRGCDADGVVGIVSLMADYSKVTTYSQFSRTNKVVVKILGTHCDSKTTNALKLGLKLPEMVLALKLGKCGEDMVRKILGSCGLIAAAPLPPNAVLVMGLLAGITLLLQEDPSSHIKLTSYMVEIVMKRCKGTINDDIVTKVSSALSHLLKSVFDAVNSDSQPEHDTLLSHALTWTNSVRSFILTHMCGKEDMMNAVYCFGAHFGNFGSLACRKTKYEMSSKFVEVSVDLFEQCRIYSSTLEDKTVKQNLVKRVQLWSDVLRYDQHHTEAGVAAARGFMMGCLSLQELVCVWVKCKRDARKGGSEALKDVTVCDVMREAKKRHREAEGVVMFDQDAALLREIQCYKQQKYNTLEEQLLCGRTLATKGHTEIHRVWGLLTVTEALWTSPDMETQEQEAANSVQEAKHIIQKAKADGMKESVMLELEALVHFWEYLCYIQTMYNKADAEVKESKKPNPFTVQLVEPGEEEQTHDRCEGRPTSLLSLHSQHLSLQPLQTALNIWDQLVVENLPLENPGMTCASLTSVGYIYHLSGLTAPTLQAWGLLIALARRHTLHNYLIKGIVELIVTAPELVNGDVLVTELEGVMSSVVPPSPQDTSHACLMLSASVATAFLYYKTGQYKAGVVLIQEALKSEILRKRTIKTTEVQTMVHLVASLYAWLPPWLLGPGRTFDIPCFSLALLACREANALVLMALTDSNTDVICWRHRVASLLLTTTSWLGHLSITTAQPRMARAYVEKSLQFSQQLILPLRIAECLELLARVDVMCDQLEDCRVKVDSLEALLRTHPSSSPSEEVQEMVADFTKLTVTKPTRGKRTTNGPEIFCDPIGDGARMRTESGTQELNLKQCLASAYRRDLPTQDCMSPSLDQLEKGAFLRFSVCPEGGVRCVLCSTPGIHRLRVSTAVLLSLLHANSQRFCSAEKCIEQAQSMYEEISEREEEVSSFMLSFIQRDIKKWVRPSSMFLKSRLNLVHLQILHGHTQCLGLEGKWEKAMSVNIKALQTLASQDTQLLIQDMHFVALISLQGRALEKVINTRSNSPEEDTDQQPTLADLVQNDADENNPVTTPKKNKRESGNRTKNLLNAPRHTQRRNIIFSSASDEEDAAATATVPPSRHIFTPHKPPAQTPNKFFKSARKKVQSGSARKRGNENRPFDRGCGEIPSILLEIPSDLPLVSLANSPSKAAARGSEHTLTASHSQQSEGMESGKSSRVYDPLVSPKPKTSNKDRGVTSRGRNAVSLSHTPDDKEHKDNAKARSSRGKTASSTSKVRAEPKATSRTRASRSLRLL